MEIDFVKSEKVICPECKKESSKCDWADSEVPCDDCGSHFATVCPLCEEHFDSVWGYDKIEKINSNYEK